MSEMNKRRRRAPSRANCHRFSFSLLGAALVLAGAGPEVRAQTAGAEVLPASAPELVAIPATAQHGRAKGKRLQAVEVKAVANRYGGDQQLQVLKSAAPLRDVPQSATVLTQDLLRDQAAHSMLEAVRYVPGIGFAQGEGHRDAPIFRGITATADFYVDGVRDDLQYFRDPYNAERIEVLRGPNALVFGRGGSGGAINRVTKRPEPSEGGELGFTWGSWQSYRAVADWNQPLGVGHALRVNGLYEHADSYRQYVDSRRSGLNPTFAWQPDGDTELVLGYEYFEDKRTVDRGVPSFQGRPLAVDASTFFGDPDQSHSRARVNSLGAQFSHQWDSGLVLRQRLQYADYGKFYQNVFAGAVNAVGDQVQLSGYNNATERENAFSQTDWLWAWDTGSWEHQALVGLELGRQETDNFRATAFLPSMSPPTTSILVPVSNPVVHLPWAFAQVASDADNTSDASLAALYAQDQIRFSPQWLLVLGGRYERLRVDLNNHRNQTRLRAEDQPFSPRAGLVYQPSNWASVYASYSVTYTPRAGEQLASLTPSNQSLKPERFKNYELGAKWDLSPDLSASLAWFRLNRENVVVPDPVDTTRTILVDGQRVRGWEASLAGRVTERWQVIGAYAYQDGEITHAQSASVPAGATLAQVPQHAFSLWNRYDFSPAWGIGLGFTHRDEVFVATDNLVTLPGFNRFDGAVYYAPHERVRVQLNVENLLDKQYYVSAHNNNNIMPGSPRAFRLGVSYRF